MFLYQFECNTCEWNDSFWIGLTKWKSLYLLLKLQRWTIDVVELVIINQFECKTWEWNDSFWTSLTKWKSMYLLIKWCITGSYVHCPMPIKEVWVCFQTISLVEESWQKACNWNERDPNEWDCVLRLTKSLLKTSQHQIMSASLWKSAKDIHAF